jgi:hypothetical protein
MVIQPNMKVKDVTAIWEKETEEVFTKYRGPN